LVIPAKAFPATDFRKNFVGAPLQVKACYLQRNVNQGVSVNNNQRILILSFLIAIILIGCAEKGAKTGKEDVQHQETSGVVSAEGAELHYVT